MKKTFRLTCLAMALFLIAAFFTGCSGSGGEDAAPPANNEGAQSVGQAAGSDGTIRVAASLASFSNSPFCVYIYESLVDVCERNGWELTAVDAEADPTKQTTQIETLILQEPDIMLVWPKDRSAINTSIMAINEANIPCFIINADLMDEYQQYATAFCGPSQYDLAYTCAQWMMEDLGEGDWNIVLVNGQPAETTYVLRSAGFYDAFEDFKAEYGCNINVLDDQFANADRNQAQALMENWLSVYGEEVDAILSVSDHVTLGAIAALEAAGKQNDYPIYSIDGMKEYFDYIEQGVARMTILQAPKYQLERFEDVVKRFMAGEELEYHQYSEFHPVHAGNIDQYEPAY